MSSGYAPLIFWLLAGYFRAEPFHFKKTGLFRVTASDMKVRELEIQMSQGNFHYLKKTAEPHVVANYWKRLLREMKEPLVPQEQYEAFS